MYFISGAIKVHYRGMDPLIFASVLSGGAVLVGAGLGSSLYSFAWGLLNKDIAKQYYAVCLPQFH